MAALYQSWLSTAGADISFAVEAQLEAEAMRAEAAQHMAGAIDADTRTSKESLDRRQAVPLASFKISSSYFLVFFFLFEKTKR